MEILGESPPIRSLRAEVRRLAALESVDGMPSVLLLGETGTGKGIIANAIHYASARASAPFVEINCAAIPATLLEAELFGYERGAYTGAEAAKPGLFEAAEGGTLFLDEIGHMAPSLQVKLLKAIEDRSVRRLGGLRPKSIKARIIAATNRDLEVAIAEGAFRSDLYFRIKVLTMVIPPLRTRGADITLLATHFLGKFARRYGRTPRTLTPEAEAVALAYPWPGNVRELAHVMERATILHDKPNVTVEDLGLSRTGPAPVVVKSDEAVQVDFSAGGIVLDDVERQLIVKALEATGSNRTHAAQLLGITRDTLRYRMEKFRLH
jgi:two-component system, NtrC family, response regulator AtoC